VAYNNAYGRAEGTLRDSCSFAEKLPGGEKRLARSSLAAALGLADGGRASSGRTRFCVMREQRSELWFIRRSRDLADSGMKLILSGYQCQVFLDFFEVEDDERGLYSAVYEALGGAGASDFSATVQDVALKELYATLAALVTPELLAWARNSFASSHNAKAPKRPGAAELLKSAAAPALAFYAKTRSLMREAAAEEGLPGDASIRGSRIPEARRAALSKRDEAVAKSAAKRFASSLAALAAMAPPRAKAAAPAHPEAALLLEKELKAPGSPELAISYAVFDALKLLCSAGSGIGPDASEGARRIVDRYCLDRKLREALRAAGMHGDEAYKAIGLAKALLPKLGNEGEKRLDPATLLNEWSQDEEIRGLLGFNVFGGVTWFNKERFEEAARKGALYGSLDRDDLESAKCAIVLISAAEKAGYSLEALDAILAPAPRPKTKAASKKPKAAPAKAKPSAKAKPVSKSSAKAKPSAKKATAIAKTPAAKKPAAKKRAKK
jgi:hypothetical protein